MDAATQWQRLIPFGDQGPEGVALTAQVRVLTGPQGQAELHLLYRLEGAETMLLPAPAPEGARPCANACPS